MLYKIILVSIIHRKNKSEILLIRRNRDPDYGKWSLPGGTGALETEADPQLAILKEVPSDFGTDIIDPKLFHIKYAAQPGPSLHLYFQGELSGEPKIRSTNTIKEMKWFAIEEISHINLAFENTDKDIINQFREEFSVIK